MTCSIQLWANRRGRLVDISLGAAICFIDFIASSSPSDNPTAYLVAYAALVFFPLAVRRHWPRAVFWAVLSHSVLGALLFEGYLPIVAVWFALYTVATESDRVSACVCLIGAAIPGVLNVASSINRQPLEEQDAVRFGLPILMSTIYALIFGAGRWTAWSIEQRRVIAQRSAAEAIAVERARIARDLHDIVAHSVTTMMLLSAGAGRLLHTDPDRATILLRNVDETGQQAILELQRMLGLLRATPKTIDDQRQTGQRPGLEALSALLERIRSTGLDVIVETKGTPHPLDPGMDIAVYRIIQEALTNADRYADKTNPARLRLTWHADRVEVQVRNRLSSGRSGRDRLSTGHGLLGMNERALAVNGHLHAGVEGEDNWVVQAELPMTFPSRP